MDYNDWYEFIRQSLIGKRSDPVKNVGQVKEPWGKYKIIEELIDIIIGAIIERMVK